MTKNPWKFAANEETEKWELNSSPFMWYGKLISYHGIVVCFIIFSNFFNLLLIYLIRAPKWPWFLQGHVTTNKLLPLLKHVISSLRRILVWGVLFDFFPFSRRGLRYFVFSPKYLSKSEGILLVYFICLRALLESPWLWGLLDFDYICWLVPGAASHKLSFSPVEHCLKSMKSNLKATWDPLEWA